MGEGAAVSEEVEIVADEILEGWCVTQSEACHFNAIAVFGDEGHARAFVEYLRTKCREEGGYDDVVVVPARALVHAANHFDEVEGRAALAEMRDSKD